MKFKHDAAYYTPEHLMSGNVSFTELKKEYTRLRKNAGKRLRNLERYKGGMYSETKTADDIRAAMDIKPFSEKDKRAQKAAMASYVSQMQDIFSKPNTIPEMNVRTKESLSYLKERGYDFIDESNIVEFWKFIDEYREQNKGIYSKSPEGEVIDLYIQAKQKSIPIESIKNNFDAWLDNLKKLQVMPDVPPDGYNSTWYAKRLGVINGRN